MVAWDLQLDNPSVYPALREHARGQCEPGMCARDNGVYAMDNVVLASTRIRAVERTIGGQRVAEAVVGPAGLRAGCYNDRLSGAWCLVWSHHDSMRDRSQWQ